MRILYIFLPVFLFVLNASGQANCLPATAKTDLDIANVRAKIFCGSDMWWDLIGYPAYEVPKNSGKHSLFAGSFWFGGIDNNGQLRVAVQTYRQSGNDFWPGPIDSISQASCSAFDRHWKLLRSDVASFAAGGSATQAIIDYPGNWAGSSLAPYVDVNADGFYNYLDGDYPLFDDSLGSNSCNCNVLHGDQVLWWVVNDVGNYHQVESNPGQAVGIEIRCQAFAYNSSDEDISNATFYEYMIINKNTTTVLDSVMFGSWVDVEIGNYLDDYVGCDVGRGMGYGYNADFNDEGIAGYGMAPPAVGLDFLRGPEAEPGDGLDNDMDSCLDCSYLKDANGTITGIIPDTLLPEQFKLSYFVYYNNDNNPVTGNPDLAEEYYNYMHARWRNGNPVLYGGDGAGGGIGATVDNCRYMFPGDSDPYHWGTNGIPENPWDELSAGNMPGDRRFLSSVGPYTMLPGEVSCIQTAVLWAQDSAGPAASLQKLKLAHDKIDGPSTECFQVSASLHEVNKYDLCVFPVPATNIISFQMDHSITSATLVIFDVHGKMIASKSFEGFATRWDCKQIESGIYFYRLLTNSQVIASGKLVRE